MQKGGTTTLQLLLDQHPEVWLPSKKELHFFSLHYSHGAQWYSGCFVDAKANQCCGEITPYYIFHPHAPQRIAELLPDVRLIVLLRDPVERCLSQYFHSCRWGLETLGLDESLASENDRLLGAELMLAVAGASHQSHQEHSYLARSRYELQLSRYEQRFDSQQMLVLRSEDLFENGPHVWARVQSFLQLDAVPFPDGVAPANAGSGEVSEVPIKVRERLREGLEQTYREMEERYGISW